MPVAAALQLRSQPSAASGALAANFVEIIVMDEGDGHRLDRRNEQFETLRQTGMEGIMPPASADLGSPTDMLIRPLQPPHRSCGFL